MVSNDGGHQVRLRCCLHPWYWRPCQPDRSSALIDGHGNTQFDPSGPSPNGPRSTRSDGQQRKAYRTAVCSSCLIFSALVDVADHYALGNGAEGGFEKYPWDGTAARNCATGGAELPPQLPPDHGRRPTAERVSMPKQSATHPAD